MKSKVTIVADVATGTVIHMSNNNPEYGYVKLQQIKTMVDDNGFLRRQTLSSLIQAPIGILQEMGYYAGKTLDGNIIIKESLTPFNKKTPERDLKIAGKTGIPCTIEGKPIYRKTIYKTSENAVDITIQHDNVDELRNAYLMQKESTSVMQPNKEFEL